MPVVLDRGRLEESNAADLDPVREVRSAAVERRHQGSSTAFRASSSVVGVRSLPESTISPE
jgi:hypothetical protein